MRSGGAHDDAGTAFLCVITNARKFSMYGSMGMWLLVRLQHLSVGEGVASECG